MNIRQKTCSHYADSRELLIKMGKKLEGSKMITWSHYLVQGEEKHKPNLTHSLSLGYSKKICNISKNDK
jgi:hypothetical protein